jgi:hypothetical protein
MLIVLRLACLLVQCAWLAWFFLFGSLHLSLAQEPTSFSQEEARKPLAANEDDHVLGADETDPAPEDESAVRSRPVVRRFGAKRLTLEQQEEAKRLSAIAARMGTDPTAIVGRVQTLFRYDALEGGSRTSNVVGRIDVPYHNNLVLRADLPYVWSNPNQPGTSHEDGVSDLLVRAGGRVYSDPADTIFVGMDFTFPTAYDKLGTGKYTVGPGVATAHVFPAWGSLIFAMLQHQFSVGGDPSRNEISASRLQCWFNTIWSDHWWTQIEAIAQMDWERKGKTSMTMEFEGGYRFTKDWGAWFRPGVGLWGQNLPGAYSWTVEVGIRRMFVGF